MVESLFSCLPLHWKVTTLGECCITSGGNIQTGPFGSQLHASDYVAFGIPSIMPQNIGDNRVFTEGIARITPEDAARLSRYLVQTGDIVYSRRGDVERRALIRAEEDGWLCGTGCLRVRFGNSEVDPLYASYYLGHPSVRGWIVRHAVGATMPNLNTSILSALPFVIPPLTEQKAIAHILGTLDDKIELNREMNQTLEAMARAIFKSWFVDFDPVCAKMEGRLPAGIDAATAELFPDEFEESALGMIPKGWRVKSLDQIAHFLNGLALQKYPPTDDNYLPVIKIAELRRGINESTAKASLYIDNKYIIQDGDILFSWSGSLGVCAWCGGKGALNQHLFKVTSVEYPKWFYYQWIKYHLPQFQEIAASKATTMGHIQRHHLDEAKVIVPPQDTLQMIDKAMEPLLNLFISNNLEARTLASIRDTLLPKLLSGEIRVKEAEKIAAKAM